MKKVKDVMTSDHVMYCYPETKLQNAAKMMKENDFVALPVVDKKNKVLGIITDRDIGLTLAQKTIKNPAEKSVNELISHTQIHTVKTEDSLKKALHEMRINKIGRMPVTDDHGILKGIITVDNLINISLNKKGKFGKVTSSKENLARTIKSIFDRNISN